jgi:hypothetical protein
VHLPRSLTEKGRLDQGDPHQCERLVELLVRDVEWVLCFGWPPHLLTSCRHLLEDEGESI